MKILIAGWFSFREMGTTAGDLFARDVVASWLADAGISYDISTVAPFGEGVDWQTANPAAYTHVVFVCGPFGNGPPVTQFLQKFRSCRLFGINLSMLQDLNEWNPFEVLFERDSTRTSRPDISFLHRTVSHALAGLILVHPQEEYGERGGHQEANQALLELLRAKNIVAMPIDTCLENNRMGLSNATQIEALISRMDFVVTTRLHGLVLALKNGIPALVVDPIKGNAKVSYQASVLGWPAILGVDELSEERLADLYKYCLTAEARVKARECGAGAIRSLAGLRDEFLAAVIKTCARNAQERAQ